MKENMFFELSKVLEISKKGKFEETGAIEVVPPSMDNFNAVSDFEQLFMGSVVSAGKMFGDDEKDKTPDEEKSALEQLKSNTPGAKEIRLLITVSQAVSIKDLFRAFKKIALKTAFVLEGVLMKDSHFDKMGIDDSLRFMCEYASFFTFPLLLGGKQEETSGSETSATSQNSTKEESDLST